MKKAVVSSLSVITLVVGLNIAVPAATARDHRDDYTRDHDRHDGRNSNFDQRDNRSDYHDRRDDHPGNHDWRDDRHDRDFTHDGDGGHSDASKKRGIILVGPSASGEALRILSTAYKLRPLTHDNCRTCLGIVVGREDLFNPFIVRRLREAYKQGHGVALTNATQRSVQHFHDLLAHHGSAQPPTSAKSADLVAFRKAFRADGQPHSSSHILLSRMAAPSVKCPLTRKDRDKQRLQQRTADEADVKALERVFSATPVVPGKPPGADPQNLINLAESYESHGIQTDSNGDQVQLINTVWAARSFQNSSDFYYVNQEADYKIRHSTDETVTSWINSTDSSAPYQNLTLLQPSPQTTMQATQVTSGVSDSIGISVGFSTATGPNASVTSTTTISNSNTTTVPAMDINNNADPGDGSTGWSYVVNDLNAAGTIDLYNNWIWQVPFSSYGTSGQGEFIINNGGSLTGTITGLGNVQTVVGFVSSVPWPFGENFQIQPPAVTAISPGCVDSGAQFTITGTGLYPSLVQAVLVNGSPVSPDAITSVSDTQINVIAPDTVQCHFGCPVAVQTNEGTSNTNFEIEISSFCGG